MKSIRQIREASGGKEAYQKFFNSILKKFGVDSPSELKGDKKKEFFDAIDKGWDGDNEKAESVSEAKKLSGGKGKAKIDINENTANVDLLEEEYGIAPGQACVFYSKNDNGHKVLGGGWIVL